MIYVNDNADESGNDRWTANFRVTTPVFFDIWSWGPTEAAIRAMMADKLAKIKKQVDLALKEAQRPVKSCKEANSEPTA